MYWDNPSPENRSAQDDEYLNPEYYRLTEPASTTPRYTPPPDPYAKYKQEIGSELYDPYNGNYAPSEDMGAYRGPDALEGYTPDPGNTQRDASESGSSDGSGRRRSFAGAGGAIGAGALFLKFGVAGITAFASVVIYAAVYGWTFGIGLVALLFIHESGHAIVMKLKGIPIKGMIFIPLLGAAVVMNQMPRNARDEAEVGIAGPVAGTIAATFCFIMAKSSPTPGVWASLAYFGFFLNLFNLIPVVPFDGGRVVSAIDRRMWIVGFLGLLAFLAWSWLNGTFSVWLLMFTFLAATQLFSRSPRDEASRAYYDVPMGTRIVIGLLYFGLAGGLILGMMMAQAMMRIG